MNTQYARAYGKTPRRSSTLLPKTIQYGVLWHLLLLIRANLASFVKIPPRGWPTALLDLIARPWREAHRDSTLEVGCHL